MNGLFSPLARALSQLSDRAFVGVVVRGVIWAAICFAALHVVAIWAIHQLLGLEGWIAWAADALGFLAASLLAVWLFLPIAAAIGTLYLDRIALAVERRWYPLLPPAEPAPLSDQVIDGLMLGLRILAFSLVGLVLALLLPGIGLVLGWAMNAYGLGRGLFVTVAMRRMQRDMAQRLYRANRLTVLAQGGAMAFAAYIPFANLLIPVIGTAAMVHVLDQVMTRPPGRQS